MQTAISSNLLRRPFNENGRYAGEVRILLNGRPLADLPPDPDLKSAEPVPGAHFW